MKESVGEGEQEALSTPTLDCDTVRLSVALAEERTREKGGKGTDEKLIELGPVVVHDSGVLIVKATAEDAAAATKARVNFMTGREMRLVELRE